MISVLGLPFKSEKKKYLYFSCMYMHIENAVKKKCHGYDHLLFIRLRTPLFLGCKKLRN